MQWKITLDESITKKKRDTKGMTPIYNKIRKCHKGVLFTNALYVLSTHRYVNSALLSCCFESKINYLNILNKNKCSCGSSRLGHNPIKLTLILQC